MQAWWETVYGFAVAVMNQDADVLRVYMAPNSDIELTYRIFGFAPLVFLMKGHLGFDGLTASRAAWEQPTGRRPRIEVVWVDQRSRIVRSGGLAAGFNDPAEAKPDSNIFRRGSLKPERG